MNDLWQSLPREDCGIRRVNGATWVLIFDALVAIATWLIWHFA